MNAAPLTYPLAMALLINMIDNTGEINCVVVSNHLKKEVLFANIDILVKCGMPPPPMVPPINNNELIMRMICMALKNIVICSYDDFNTMTADEEINIKFDYDNNTYHILIDCLYEVNKKIKVLAVTMNKK